MKVLIVKLGAIGDVIMALPMITALRRRDPGVKITWLCGDVSAPVVRLVDGVEVIAISEAALLAGSTGRKIREILTAWLRLFGRRFDLVITPYYDVRYRLLSAAALAKERRRFNRGKGRWWPVPGRYHSDEYVRLVTNVDDATAESAAMPRIDARLSEKIRSLMAASGESVIALAPGGARNALGDSPLRRWPLESYGRLGAELVRRGYRVALTGAASDGWVREAFRDQPVLDLIGQTVLADLIAVYRACAAVVTHDSGPMHLALLAGASTVALFGPTQPSEKVARGERLRVIWGGAELPCRPCYDGKTYAPCLNNRCLVELAPESVADAVEELASRRRDGARPPVMAAR